MKNSNIEKIIRYLFENGPSTIYAISKKTNLSTSSVFNYIKYLYDKGIVIKTRDNKYCLQPLFYEKEFWLELEDYLMPLLNLINDYVIGEPDLIIMLYFIVDILYKNKIREEV